MRLSRITGSSVPMSSCGVETSGSCSTSVVVGGQTLLKNLFFFVLHIHVVMNSFPV